MLCSTHILLKAQQPTFPADFATNIQCPFVEQTYTISNIDEACYDVVTSGHLSSPTIDFDATVHTATVKVTWDESFSILKLTALKKPGVCLTKNTEERDSKPKTIKNSTPVITGPSSIVIGQAQTVTYTASLNYQYELPFGSTPIAVTNFKWTFPAGWQVSNGITDQADITFFIPHTNTSSGGVSAQGINSCDPTGNSVSLTHTKNVTRFVEAPCPVLGPESVICGDQTNIAYSCTPNPALTGYTYVWSVTNGWAIQGPNTGSTIIVKPNGTTGSTISCRAKAFNILSAQCTRVVPVTTFDPLTIVKSPMPNNPNLMCNSGNFYLSVQPPTGSIVTWAVTPASLFNNPTGNGTSANLSKKPNKQGNATLKFTISNACGSATLSKSFWAGVPDIVSTPLYYPIDGVSSSPAMVCLGTHFINATAQGAAPNNCITWNANTSYPYIGTCNHFDISMNIPSGPGVYINATANNFCGVGGRSFVMSPITCSGSSIIAAYPNPASDVLTVEVRPAEYTDNKDDKERIMNRIDLFDFSGKMVYSIEPKSNAISINLPNLPSGIYLLRAFTDDEVLTTKVQIAASEFNSVIRPYIFLFGVIFIKKNDTKKSLIR